MRQFIRTASTTLSFAQKLSLLFILCSLVVSVSERFLSRQGFLLLAVTAACAAILIILPFGILSGAKARRLLFGALGLLAMGYTFYRGVPTPYQYGKQVKVQLRLTSYPEVSRRGLRYTGVIEGMLSSGQGPAESVESFGRMGKVLVGLPFPKKRIERGYTIQADGLLFPLPYDKDEGYARYLHSSGITALFEGYSGSVEVLKKPSPLSPIPVASRLKRYIENTNERLLPFPHSVFATALLTGNREMLPRPVAGLFKRSGTMHILAVSGLHVGFLSAFLLLLLNLLRLRRNITYALLCLFIVFFMIFIGERPSVRRASLMALCGIACYLFDRDRDYINVLALSFTVLWIVNPASLFNPGFLLSFCATFGILLLVPTLHSWLRHHMPSFLAASLATSLAVQIYLFPVLASFFGSFPYVNLVANIPIVPLTGISLAVEVLTLLLYPVFLPLGIIAAEVNTVVISTIIRLAWLFAKVPPLEIGNFPGWLVVVYLGAVTVGIVIMLEKAKKSLK